MSESHSCAVSQPIFDQSKHALQMRSTCAFITAGAETQLECFDSQVISGIYLLANRWSLLIIWALLYNKPTLSQQLYNFFIAYLPVYSRHQLQIVVPLIYIIWIQRRLNFFFVLRQSLYFHVRPCFLQLTGVETKIESILTACRYYLVEREKRRAEAGQGSVGDGLGTLSIHLGIACTGSAFAQFRGRWKRYVFPTSNLSIFHLQVLS